MVDRYMRTDSSRCDPSCITLDCGFWWYGWGHNSRSPSSHTCQPYGFLLIPTMGAVARKGSHVYFLLIVAMVLLLWRQIVLLWHQVTMVALEQHLYQTIVLPRKRATGSIHDYLFCYCPILSILFGVLRIELCFRYW